MSASTQRKNRLAEIEAGTYKKQNTLKQQDEKKAREKRTAIICSAVVVVIVLAAILLNLIPALQRRAELRRYTEGVAVTIGDRDYSPAEINYYYGTQFNNFANNYGYYGLDASQGAVGLGSMAYTGPELEGKNIETWRDYFLDATYEQLIQIQTMLTYARENNITLTDEEKEEIESDLASYSAYAAMYGFSDVDQFMSAYFGTGFTLDTLRGLSLDNALANKAYTAYQESLSFTPEELNEEFVSFNGDYDRFSYAYYVVAAKETEDEGEAELAKREAEHEAEAIITSYKDGGDVEDLYDRFNGYIEEELGGSAARSDDESGMYLDGVFAEWMKDEARQPGDVEKFEDGGDYYVVLFLGRESADYSTVNVRHILIKAEKADDEETWSEEALAAAKAEAERILVEWKEGDMTEESFAKLAEEYSEDPGSVDNGGLYENVYKGQMVPEFEAFCFAEGRKAGDTDIVYGTNGGYAGYHVMFYSGEGRAYSEILAEDSLVSKAMTEWMDSTTLTAVPGPEEALIDPVTGPVKYPEEDEPGDEDILDEEETEEEPVDGEEKPEE